MDSSAEQRWLRRVGELEDRIIGRKQPEQCRKERLKSKRILKDLGENTRRFNIPIWGTSLLVQCLRLCTPKAGGSDLNPGQETRSRICNYEPTCCGAHMLKLKIPCAKTKTQCSKVKKQKQKHIPNLGVWEEVEKSAENTLEEITI